MEIIANTIFIINFFVGIYMFTLSMKFKRDWIVRMRLTAIILATLISFVYPLLNIVWNINEKDGIIQVPKEISLSFSYWELSTGLLIMFVFGLIYLSIKS